MRFDPEACLCPPHQAHDCAHSARRSPLSLPEPYEVFHPLPPDPHVTPPSPSPLPRGRLRRSRTAPIRMPDLFDPESAPASPAAPASGTLAAQGGAPLTLQGLDRLRDALEAVEAGTDGERSAENEVFMRFLVEMLGNAALDDRFSPPRRARRVRSGFQRRIYHLRRPATSPHLRLSASASSLISGFVTPDPATQPARASRAAQREVDRQRDAAMERARDMTVAELADRLRRGVGV